MISVAENAEADLAHLHTQQAPNEIARLILYFFPLFLRSRRQFRSGRTRSAVAVLVRKCCFSDRNICYCDYVNASLYPLPRL
jgi:hypothetical protein